jgi:hypothetical protein
MGLTNPETWQLLANVVTVVGLPFAVVVFVLEQRKERLLEQEELYQRLSDEYTSFMKLVLSNADLGLLRRGQQGAGGAGEGLSAEQLERRYAMFDILVALFERAYILVYEERMDAQTARLWQSWEDYMREWCRRAEFRELLPQLLRGEDPGFVAHIQRVCRQEERAEARA